MRVFMCNRKKLCKRAAALVFGIGLVLGILPATQAQAANEGTATLRIISTTDLHGQSVNQNYDSASEHPVGSLAQVYTLIKNARSSLKYGASVTLDIGDTVYGYGSDSIMNGAVTGTEYMYAEMKTMGYDAITIGNHDFDYGYEYIAEALKDAGMNKKVVVSNVYSAKTRNPVWAENKVITKTMTTTKGVKKKVRVGLFGVTDPMLTSHYSHTGILVVEDIVESAKEQVAKLKEQNVDVIVALAHSGIGSEQYSSFASDAVYQLSKVDGIDAIMMGDDHVNFPSDDANVQKYYSYPGITEDGMINGKVAVSVADHGAGIGIADLKLKFANGGVKVVSKSAKLKMVKSTTEPDASIVELNDAYQEQFDRIYSTSLGTVSSSINNFFATLEDNAAIQAANESKIRFGIEYINMYAPEYADLPVIACTDYQMVGLNSANNYINIKDNFTVADTLNVQDWNRDCTSVYWVTGEQLREWLEWRTASAYQDPAQAANIPWTDDEVKARVQSAGLSPLLRDEWLENWANYNVFDGIEYEIDVTQPVRYGKSGVLLNSNAHRITKLTCNGVDVTDTQRFVVVCSQLTTGMSVVTEITTQKIVRGNMLKGYNNTLLQEYVQAQCAQGDFNVKADDNWKILMPEATNYLLKTSPASEDVARGKAWYIQTLGITSKHSYYQAALGQEQTDVSGPLLVLGLGNTKKTNHNVTVFAETSDASKVTTLKYFPGVLTADSSSWAAASNILEKGSFEATGNGTYSVLAGDALGNSTVKYITVSNMDSSILEAPDVDTYTNRKHQITGKAEPGATIYVKAANVTYQTVAAEDGTFSCDLAMQKADSVVEVWAEDASGRQSEKVSVVVGRTGANQPNVYEITNKSSTISGLINDSIYCKVIASVGGKTVYVPKDGGEERYMASDAYDKSLEIVNTDFSIEDGVFSLKIPVLNYGTKVKIYSIDWIDRISVVSSFVTEEVAPNMPVLKKVYAVDDRIFGQIPAAGEGPYTISASDGNETYTGTADETGFFSVQVGDLPEGSTLTVTASDTVDGKKRTSAKATVTVSSYKSLLTEYTDITFDEIDSKGTLVSGHIDDYTGPINLLIGTKRVVTNTDESGNFSYILSKPRAAGTAIVAMVRNADGTVYDICETTVKLAIPDLPELVDEVIYDTATEIKVFSVDQATAVVKVGNKYYKADKGVYDKKKGGYVYTVTLTKAPKEGTKVIVYMMNEAGKSAKLETVIEADPDKPADGQE